MTLATFSLKASYIVLPSGITVSAQPGADTNNPQQAPEGAEDNKDDASASSGKGKKDGEEPVEGEVVDEGK